MSLTKEELLARMTGASGTANTKTPPELLNTDVVTVPVQLKENSSTLLGPPLSPLRKNSIFLREAIDSPVPTSIEEEILIELQKHTLLMKQLVNAFLGNDIGLDHEDQIDSIGR
jgi:hypothetical protein